MADHIRVDAVGQRCPQPIIMLGKALRTNSTRPLDITLVTDDPTARYDVPAWCRLTGNRLVSITPLNGTLEFVVAVDVVSD